MHDIETRAIPQFHSMPVANREYLAPQIHSMNNRFHSEAKLPWS